MGVNGEPSLVLSRRPRLTYRRMCVILATISFMLVSVICLVDKLYFAYSGFEYSGRTYWKLQTSGQDGTSGSRTAGGAMAKTYVEHQREEWLEAERAKRGNGSYDLRPGSNFMLQQELVQRQRKRAIRTACKRYPELAYPHFTYRNTRNMFALDKNRLFYCSIPKAGCTNWKKVILVVEGLRQHTWNITGYQAHHGGYRGPRNFTSVTPSERNYIMYAYLKFIYVRHPFVRLVSAYRNKIDRKTSEQGTVFRGYARKIVSKYREGADLDELAAAGHYMVTWEEWIRYLTDPSELDGFNPHWMEFHKLCLPCRIQYDFVGNLETVEADSTYMFRLLGIEGVSYPSSSKRKSSDIYQQYFANVSRVDLQMLWEIYKYDFELFGFAKPDQLDGTTSFQTTGVM